MRRTDAQKHLQYFWWCYAIILIAAIVLWTSVYAIIESPDANEKLTVSYFGSSYDGAQLELELKDNIGGITSQNIRELNVDCTEQSGSLVFGSMIQTCLYSSDIIIFEESVIADELDSINFRPFTAELEARFSDIDVEYYLIDGAKCGLVIDPQGQGSSILSKYYSGNGRLLIFFAPHCENLGGIYGVGNQEDDAAIELMRFLLEETND